MIFTIKYYRTIGDIESSASLEVPFDEAGDDEQLDDLGDMTTLDGWQVYQILRDGEQVWSELDKFDKNRFENLEGWEEWDDDES